MSTRIIDAGAADLTSAGEDAIPYQNVMWISVLQSLSAYQMYRLSVGANVNPAEVRHFLLRSFDFPRAFGHCLKELENSMEILPGSVKPLECVHALQRKLKRTNCRELEGDSLHDFLDLMQLQLQGIDQAIAAAWFTPEQ